MKILHLFPSESRLPNLSVVKKTLDNGRTEHYTLFNASKICVCSFDFTNFGKINRYFCHGEIKNFNIPKEFRRKKNGAAAIILANELTAKTAKDKGIDGYTSMKKDELINALK